MFFNIDNTMDVVSQLVKLGEDLFKVYYGRTLDGDKVGSEHRDRIKAGIDKTILRNYQGTQYAEQRKSLYLKAIDHLIYSTQYSASIIPSVMA